MEAVMNGRSEATPQPQGADGVQADRLRRGFTVLELAIAMTILSAGSAVLWYGLKSSAKQERLNRLHHAAIIAARSDLESLRSIPKQDIHDTLYLSSGGSGESLLVVRTVMDSARIVNSLDEVVLDDKLSPKEAKKPLEVKVAVYRLPASETGSPPDAASLRDPESEDTPSGGGPDGKPRKLAGFILKLPEYKWY
jgi:prepilin-type N-terminal cleavage/methylation domain-containing protein